jgi:SAM-dependent methyltransferase
MQIDSDLKKQVDSTVERLQGSSEGESVIKLSEMESIHYDGRHYDLIYRNFYPDPNLFNSDLPFWIDIASQYGESILALCCGNGRLAIPLAEKGSQVTGIDISSSMLEVARKNSSQVEWIKADVRNFELDKKYSLIIFPPNSIGHLLELEAIEDCFSCVRKHLNPEGRFIIDLDNNCTQESLDFFFSQTRNLYSVYPDPDGKGTVVVTYEGEFDLTEQIWKQKLFFRLLGQEKEFLEEVTYRMYFPKELEALLKYNGFTIESRFGSYDKTPFTSQSPRQLIICRLQE